MERLVLEERGGASRPYISFQFVTYASGDGGAHLQAAFRRTRGALLINVVEMFTLRVLLTSTRDDGDFYYGDYGYYKMLCE